MSDPIWKEPCKICGLEGIDFRFTVKKGGLTGHIGKRHTGWTKKSYIERWPDAVAHFVDQAPSLERRQELRNELAERPLVTRHRDGIIESLKQLNQENYDGLSDDEKFFFDEWVEQLVQQTDRDELQMPLIQSLAFDQIFVRRLRRMQLNRTKKNKIDPQDPIFADKDYEAILQKTEERIAKGMDTLGVSRAAQLKQGSLIKSTSSSIISGYLIEIERMSPEMLDALALDEKRAFARSYDRLEKSGFCNAPDLEEEEEQDEGSALSRDAALARAGLSEGSSEQTPVVIGSDGTEDLPF